MNIHHNSLLLKTKHTKGFGGQETNTLTFQMFTYILYLMCKVKYPFSFDNAFNKHPLKSKTRLIYLSALSIL